MLPAAFVERLGTFLPEERLEGVLASFSRPKRPSVRVNTLKTTPKEALLELRALGFHPEPSGWCPYLFAIPQSERRSLTESRLYREGALYLQNPSSLLAVELLDPKPGERVLDLCAAPGGKASLIAQRMKNRGELLVVEPVRERFYRLKANLERLGVAMARPLRKDSRRIGDRNRFDRVLVDAPCSSEGTFSLDDPESFRYWSPRKIAECRRKQIGLLLAGLRALRPGGRLLYCTCTFAPEENEEVVRTVLERWRGPEEIELLPIEGELPCATMEGLDLPETRRILPDDRFQAFFLALMTKR